MIKIFSIFQPFQLQHNFNPMRINCVGYVDWVKITDWVAVDIEIAKAN